jgi:hypothetical protein
VKRQLLVAAVLVMAYSSAAAQAPQPLAGRWQYLQAPDNEGEVLDLSISSGVWYYVVEIENVSVGPDGTIRFEVGERRLSAERPALSVLGGKTDAGVDRYRMQFTGRIEAGDLVLQCADPKGGSCPASSMRFKRM